MSLTFALLSMNVSLSLWEKYDATNWSTEWSSKNTDKTARLIFNQLSRPKTVELVAKEFDDYPADLRLILRTHCNDGNASGNVRKGVQRLDTLMKGKLLREEKFVERRMVMGKDGWKSKDVNPSVAGATRKYGIIDRK